MQIASQKILSLIKLIRITRPIGIWLLLWPCLWSIAAHSGLGQIKVILIFIFGSILMRSSACIINDLFDRDLDRQVTRTKHRPLCNGELQVKDALILLVLLLIIAFILLMQLNNYAIKLSLFATIAVILYPLMKRITYWPQLFLGLTNNLGALIASAAITGEITYLSMVLYLCGIFWTLGYDSIYAFQDLEDDMAAGVKSSAIKLQYHPKLYLGLFYLMQTILLITIGIMGHLSFSYYYIILFAILHLGWQIISLDITSVANCLTRFKSNQYLGAIIFCALI
ncbi:MAG: hypothetical protein RIT35_551 [Pseudomonadota bacterium]|jgi:4-hydroxybenzoate polyprenyltransferase